VAVSRWLARLLRFGHDHNFHAWTSSVAGELCTHFVGVPVRAYQFEPGRFAHPDGPADDAVIGRVESAWSTPATDGVLGVIALDDSPRALAVDRGMRRMYADGKLSDFVGLSLVGHVRFSIQPQARALPIHGVNSVTALDLVTYPAAGG
jgi:hypothetical protein